MTLPPDRGAGLHDDGGWLSGPMAVDKRPEFSASYFVVAVTRMLGEHGVTVNISDGMVYAAEIAGADLLRVLGVKPVAVAKR